MVALLIVILVICIGLVYSRNNGDTASNEHWYGLFRHVTDCILNYYHGSSTRLFMLALQAIIVTSGVSAIYPFIRAAFQYDEFNGYWQVYLELQFDTISLSLQIISIAAVLIIVALYCYVNQKNKISAEEVKGDIEELKRIGIENQYLLKQSDEKIDKIIARVNSSNRSESMRRLLPKFKDDIKALKLISAYGHLQDIYEELERDGERDYELMATIQYYLGLCSKYMQGGKCGKHFESAYYLMLKTKNVIPYVLEGMIYKSCKSKNELEARQYAKQLQQIEPNSYWTAIPDLVFSSDLNAAYEAIPDGKNRILALANAIVIGFKAPHDQIVFNVDTYKYEPLPNVTLDNFPLWIFNLNIVASRFIRTWQPHDQIQKMRTQFTDELFRLSDAYLTSIRSTDLPKLIPDLEFLHAFTGYLLDQNENWLSIMSAQREKVHDKEVYYMAYAFMLSDKERIDEAVKLLSEYNGSNEVSILNQRLRFAFRTKNIDEIVTIFRLATEKRESIPDHFLPNFMTAIHYFYDNIKQYVGSLTFLNPLSQNFLSQYISFRNCADVDNIFLQKNEEQFCIYLQPYLAILYKKTLGLEKAVEVMQKCADTKVYDFRTDQLIAFYSEKQKYAVNLYHLLTELRKNGVVEHHLLWKEMTMAESIQDSANALEVSKLLVTHFPNDAAALLYHVKILRKLGNIEQIKTYEDGFFELDLSINNVKTLVAIYLSIGETEFALEYLYRKIKITDDQSLLDYYYTLHLNPEVEKIISQENTIVQIGDLTTIHIEDTEKVVEVNPGSVYADLEGKSIGDKVSISIQGKSRDVLIVASNNKFFRMLLKAQESIAKNQSPNIRMFDINDFNFKEDPIGALKQMIGAPEDAEAKEAAKRLNYKQGKYSLGNFIQETDEIASTYNLIFDRHFPVYTMSNSFYDNVISNSRELTKYEAVLDVTSLIMLNEIERRYKMIFTKKFVIPKSLQYLLQEMALKEEQGNPSLLYQSVLDLITIDYVDNNKTPFWNIIQNLLEWIERNCEVKIVEEKLQYDMSDNRRQIFSYTMDSLILTLQGRVLLTEDWCWPKQLNKFPSMSVYNWLHLTDSIVEKDYADFMLDCGNLGYALTSSYIQKQFKLYKDNKSNLLSNCISNIAIDPTNYRAMLNAGYAIIQGNALEETRSKVTEMFAAVMGILTPEAAYLLCYQESLIHKEKMYLKCLEDAFMVCHQNFLKDFE